MLYKNIYYIDFLDKLIFLHTEKFKKLIIILKFI